MANTGKNNDFLKYKGKINEIKNAYNARQKALGLETAGQKGARITNEKLREKRRSRYYLELLLSKKVKDKNGKETDVEYEEVVNRNFLKSLIEPQTRQEFLKAFEMKLKLFGELVEKVAQTDGEGNDIKEIVSNSKLLEIIKKRKKKK